MNNITKVEAYAYNNKLYSSIEEANKAKKDKEQKDKEDIIYSLFIKYMDKEVHRGTRFLTQNIAKDMLDDKEYIISILQKL